MKTFKTIFVFRLEALGRLPLASLEAAVGGSSHLIQSQLILKSHLLTNAKHLSFKITFITTLILPCDGYSHSPCPHEGVVVSIERGQAAEHVVIRADGLLPLHGGGAAANRR